MQTPTNTGSFGSPAGGASTALQEAITRRGAPASPTQSVTQGSTMFDPSTQPATPPTAPSPTAAPAMPQGNGHMSLDPTETKIIIQALTNRLKLHSDLQKGNLSPQQSI